MTNKDTTTKKSKPIGRPKKHEITQSKTFRLPLYLIEQMERDRMDKESLTDALIRLVKLGLLV